MHSFLVGVRVLSITKATKNVATTTRKRLRCYFNARRSFTIATTVSVCLCSCASQVRIYRLDLMHASNYSNTNNDDATTQYARERERGGEIESVYAIHTHVHVTCTTILFRLSELNWLRAEWQRSLICHVCTGGVCLSAGRLNLCYEFQREVLQTDLLLNENIKHNQRKSFTERTSVNITNEFPTKSASSGRAEIPVAELPLSAISITSLSSHF